MISTQGAKRAASERDLPGRRCLTINKRIVQVNINSYDCDGVVTFNSQLAGLRPEPNDVIITGRSYEERPETEWMLAKRSINNEVFYNPLKFDHKTRESSGRHKALTINELRTRGYNVICHYEDDEVQADIIKKECPEVHVILLVHDLTEKENVRHDEV